MKNIVILDPITKKFTQVNNPSKEKPVELTEGDKVRVIGEFQDIFGREPNQEEIYELFSEELKLKQGSRAH